MPVSLETYRKKRKFAETPEPSGSKSRSRLGQPSFVVQKHDATRLHYDFRLEVDGVLKSWAVPKGPSLNPKVKRLAMPTEDHPLDYASFEGRIPEGNYGAGQVIVWDRGTYKNLRDVPMPEAIKAGHVTIWLEGKKLRGGFSLRRMSPGQDGRASWLLVKKNDEEADPKRDVTEDSPRSIITGKRVDQIA
jgi:DNA ligase D-like protein (predicted 3'-phosphoesterase)